MRSLLVIIASVVLSVAGTAFYLQRHGNTGTTAHESAYDRVVRTGTIRCGYGIAEPWIYVDPNTKQMRGLSVEIMDAIAKTLGLKIEWAEETGWTGLAPSLNDGRTDVACSGLWLFAARSREIMYSVPFVYNAIHLYTRADETRFRTEADINRPETKIAVMEGELTDEAVSNKFPQATAIRLSNSTPMADFFVYVATRKADIIGSDPFAVATYNLKSDKKLKRVPLPEPVLTVGVAFPVGKNEFMLKHMLDSAIMELEASGTLQAIIGRYTKSAPGSLYIPASPYKAER